MKRILLLLLIASSGMALPLFAADDHFHQGNDKFAAGDFKGAIVAYQAEVASGQWSANLFYDLANAYFRSGDIGRAILNYERALQLDPHHPEAEANLRMARDQTRGLELAPSALEKLLGGSGISPWIMATAVFFWLAIVFLIAKPHGALLAGAIFSLLMTAGCAYAAWIVENGTRGKDAAIVVATDAEARVATADTAPSILVLPPGSEVIILQQRGDWNYAMLPNNRHGWIPASAAEKVRL